MKRFLLAAAMLCLPAAAHAAPCPPIPFIFSQGAPFNAPQVNTDFSHLRDCINTNVLPTPPPPADGQSIYAINYGVKADGVTSDDLAMKAAVDACNAGNGLRLVLPVGRILLTGAAQITINHCHLVGAGVGPNNAQLLGTTFLITSTTVTPFILGSGIGLTGINFFWPNQTTGATVYPPLFVDAAAPVYNMFWDNVIIINAYDGFKQSPASGGIGLWRIANSSMYASHDLFAIGSVGSYILVSNSGFGYGAWLDAMGYGIQSTIDANSDKNTMFHFTAPVTGPAGVLSIVNSSAFGWGWAFKLDATARWDFGNIDMAIDGVMTHLDTTSGGTINNVTFRCNSCTAGRGTISGLSGNSTAFKLGPNGTLRLHDSLYNTAVGTFVETAGSGVSLEGNTVAFGSVGDGANYHFVNVVGGNIGTHIELRNNVISGQAATAANNHGLTIPNTLNIGGFTMNGNRIAYVNEALNAFLGIAGARYQFAGNNTEAVAGASAVVVSGTSGLSYANNLLDKTPKPTASACGTGPTVNGTALHGYIEVGTGSPASCTMTMPFITPGANNPACVFTPTVLMATPIAAHPSGVITAPLSWVVTHATGMTGQLMYNCSAEQ